MARVVPRPAHAEVHGSTDSRDNARWYLVAVLLLPVLVLWRDDRPLYSPDYYADAWFYLGYMHNLVEFKRDDLFGALHNGERLPWILPGYVVHSIFPPLAANVILHLAVQSTATLSLFFCLRRIAGVRVSFLTTLLFSVHPWLWVATGWDYVGGVGVAFTLLALALLTRSAMSSSAASLFGAGMAIAAMSYTHLFLATLTPLLPLYYIGLRRATRQEPLRQPALLFGLWAGAGFALVTAFLAGVNYALDGNPLFFKLTIAQARRMAQDFVFVKGIWKEGQLVPWLWPGVAGCVTALVLLPGRLREGITAANAGALLISVSLLVAVAYMAALQVLGITVLGHYPYVSYLLPFVFLVIGTSLFGAVDRLPLKSYLLLCAVAAATMAILWGLPFRFWIAVYRSPAQVFELTALTAACLPVALALRRRAAGALVTVAGFAGFTAIALLQTNYLDGLDVHGNRAQYLRIMEARSKIEQTRRARPVLFWYDRTERNFHEYYGLNATYLAEFSRLSDAFPRGCDKPVTPGALIVVTSQKDDAPELARAALADCWHATTLEPRVESVHPVPSNPRYSVILVSAESKSNP